MLGLICVFKSITTRTTLGLKLATRTCLIYGSLGEIAFTRDLRLALRSTPSRSRTKRSGSFSSNIFWLISLEASIVIRVYSAAGQTRVAKTLTSGLANAGVKIKQTKTNNLDNVLNISFLRTYSQLNERFFQSQSRLNRDQCLLLELNFQLLLTIQPNK